MFRKIINSEAKTITSAAIIIGALSLVSRFLGIFRDRVLAAQFGAGDILDAYYAAFRLPDLVYNLLILGAISAGVIPVFTALLEKKADNKKEAWHLINSILNIAFVAIISICAVLFLISPYLMPLITPGFPADKMAVVVKLSRIMFLSPIFLGLSAILSSVLQAHKRFFIYSLAPIFYNVGIIIGALYFVDYWGVEGLAWGVVLGSLLHMLVQLPATFFTGYRYKLVFGLKNKNVRKIGRLMIPRTLTLIINQLNFLITTIFASTLMVGSLAIYNLANNLQSFPLGIFGVSFAVAALPVLSSLAASKKTDDFVATISSTFRQILFFTVPVSILLYVLRAQVVRVILGSGAFSWIDTRLTAAVLAIFALSLFAQGALPLIIRGFYALHNTKTPFFIGLLDLAVNLSSLFFFAWVFSFDNWFSFFVVAILKVPDLWHMTDLRVLSMPLAVSVSAVFNLFVLMLALRKHIGRLDGRKIIDSSMRIIFSSLGAGLFTYGSLQLSAMFIATETFRGIFLQGLISGSVGLLGYGFLGYWLNMEEMSIFISSLHKKLFKNIKVIEDTSQEGEGL